MVHEVDENLGTGGNFGRLRKCRSPWASVFIAALLGASAWLSIGAAPASADSAVRQIQSANAAGSGDRAPFCSALDRVRRLDAQFEDALANDWEWRYVRALMIGSMRNGRRQYAIAARNARPPIRADVEVVARFTDRQKQAAETATSMEDFGRAVLSDPARADAEEAAARVNEYSRHECGFAPRSSV